MFLYIYREYACTLIVGAECKWSVGSGVSADWFPPVHPPASASTGSEGVVPGEDTV